MIERPHARPFADCIREGDEFEEHVRDQDVVGIRSMIDDVDDRAGSCRALVEVADRFSLDHDAIEKIHERSRQRRSESVIGEEIELRNDLAQILPGLLHRRFGRDVILFRVGLDRMHDLATAEDLEFDVRVTSFELIAIDMDASCPLEAPSVTFASSDGNGRDDHDRGDGRPEDPGIQHGYRV